jgi:hypothetical protein
MTLGLVPYYRLDGECKVDMCGMPPAVAEAYVLSIMGALQRTHGVGTMSTKQALHPITFVVPPYDPAKVFFPSYAMHDFRSSGEGPDVEEHLPINAAAQYVSHEEYEQIAALDDSYVEQATARSWRCSTADDGVVATETTALGVAGVLRRLRIWVVEDPQHGTLTIEARAQKAFLRMSSRAASKASRQGSLSVLQEQGWIGNSIAHQQQDVRMGAAVRNRKGQPQKHHTML